MSNSKDWPGLVPWLIVVYIAWYLTTPYYSPRFAFLAAINFERVIVAATIVAIVARGTTGSARNNIVALTTALFLVMNVSLLLSPYAGEPECQQWASEYWKKLAMLLFIVFGLRTLDELVFVAQSTVTIAAAYQLLSWRDFLAGGAFVYQQGIIRMCGAWSARSLGAPNGYAYLCLFVLPLSYCLFQMSPNRRTKLLLVGIAALSLLSILYSGTRGAMYTAAGYGIFLGIRSAFRLQAAIMVLLAVLMVAMLPEKVVQRYFTNPWSTETTTEGKFDKIARRSGESRLEGLLDGVELGNRRPLLGYGPNSSPTARLTVRDMHNKEIGLHNLYGQVIGELGWGGFAIWLCLIGGAVRGLLRLRIPMDSGGDDFERRATALRQGYLHCFGVMLVFGLGAHSLYDYKWLMLLGLQVVLTSIVTARYRATPPLP